MTKIKICGLTRPQDIEAVNAARPDFAGFVFAEKSRRRVTPAQAAALRRALRFGIVPVGVFANQPVQEILSMLSAGTIAVAQLHGQEPEEMVRQIQQAGFPVIRAFRVQSAADAARALNSTADVLLLDSGSGSGRTFDWNLIPDIRRPWFLAGGLCAENAAEAVRQVRPWGADVSSGVETDGVKDAAKIAELIRRIRNV
ncbi:MULTISPECIES: phosphoribosylanthranilate isomerase [Caproicibacterium]|uniref:N-(5'-phosphoribosyl)anthranilate isomerase n=1 Tax=Caproicibacterium argilliputei TaxID=3030016 RepID=A0AA97D8S8_9FIRM|nr:phosphoribosylanthranilate isomerase [Caproicibacterium argilliputei]WOC32404.1 phosphoribosylanthranilate isomerase [Caproicibacterium argilliputei]